MPAVTGPYQTLVTADGLAIPWYIIPFDKNGRCKAPATRAHLIDALATQGFTHLYLFSHGWNNDWAAASERYKVFVEGFIALRKAQGIAAPDGYRPLLAGIFWPGTSLVLPWEHGPRFAAGEAVQAEAEAEDTVADDIDRSIDMFAEDLPEALLARFYALANADSLDAKGLEELATLLLPVMGEDTEYGTTIPDANELAAAWMAGTRRLAGRGSDRNDDEGEDFGTASPVARSGEPVPASILDTIDPRHALRLATVWKMKDRAGTVGARGVNPLLCDMLQASAASVHLVGHSYGCKVMLSAVGLSRLPRPITSALLLQPAISHLAFAKDADGEGHPGGYRAALEWFAQPVICTFSSHDVALARTFHLAVRRKSDLGEIRIAAGAPSRFAALGGYGPGKMLAGEHLTIEIRDPGIAYPEIKTAGLRVLALQGSRLIKGHGDILQPATYWALHQQVMYS